ncbi:hypothetical protein [Shewanella algae]|uniref:hypothetical protein n=2 Tax=Shewanella algae TaxID=38313 RepID=UPI0021BE35DC|nr:hypothetical protein [Shewanella algae]
MMTPEAKEWIKTRPELSMRSYADVLQDELDQLGVPCDVERQVSERVWRWLLEGEPAHLDMALLQLDNAGKPIPKLLQAQLVSAAILRLNGASKRTLPIKKMEKESFHWHELRWMVLLITYCAVKKPDAAKMAADKAITMFGREYSLIASSLEKEYEKLKKSESSLRADLLLRRTPSWSRSVQESFLSNFKSVNEIPEHRHGQRR